MAFLHDYIWLIIIGVILVFVILSMSPKKKQDNVKPKPADDPKPPQGRPQVNDASVPWSKVSEIVEQERHRIASDLHDELGTLLSVIHLDLELVLREAASLSPHGEARLLEVRKNLNHVIESIRVNIWSLSPQMFEQIDLGFALQELCKKLDAYKGTHLKFVQTGDPRTLTQKEKLHLFRIVQELLTNAMKHSGAWNISVIVQWHQDKLVIMVEDDGSGYQRAAHEESTANNGGMGSGNMIKRANLIGAVMKKEELARGLRVSLEMDLGPSYTPASSSEQPALDKVG